MHVQRLCPRASDALNSSSYVPISALCSRNRTQNIGLVSFYTKPMFHAWVPLIAKISRYKTRSAYNLALNDQYRDFSDFYVSLLTEISFFFFSIPFIIFALLFSLPPCRNSDPGSHSRLFSPPTHNGSCLAFLSREDFSSFFPRRLASNSAIQKKKCFF